MGRPRDEPKADPIGRRRKPHRHRIGPSTVRLPKDYRIEGTEVRIRRHGAAVILEPIACDWGWLDALAQPLDVDFLQAASEQPAAEHRPERDRLFD